MAAASLYEDWYMKCYDLVLNSLASNGLDVMG
jgi:hypothetical protein